jgi:hypothetical protein
MPPLRARLRSWPVLAALLVLAVLAGVLVQRSSGEDLTATDRAFAKVCREHGGTPKFAPGSGDYVKDFRGCEIEYAGDSYEMYAVHPEGFSTKEAAAARRACTLLARQKRADARKNPAAAGSTRVVWHERSGICESKP